MGGGPEPGKTERPSDRFDIGADVVDELFGSKLDELVDEELRMLEVRFGLQLFIGTNVFYGLVNKLIGLLQGG